MARTPGNINNPTLLEAALEGLEIQKTRIEEQIQQVRKMLGRRGAKSATTAEAAPAVRKGRKRPLSDAARKRIAAAQKKRWAEYRKKGGAAAKE